jgi:hypothetical protein
VLACKKDLQFCVCLSDGDTWTAMKGCDLFLVDLAKVPMGTEASDTEFRNAIVAGWDLWSLLREKLLLLRQVKGLESTEALKP